MRPDSDATLIQGVNTAGTVRVNCLANLEALLVIFANLAELTGIGICIFLLFRSTRKMSRGRRVFESLRALSFAVLGFCVPPAINYAVATARDFNILS